MPPEMKRPYTFGGGALVASGVLFAVLAFLDFRAGPPPSNGAAILLWRDAQAFVLDFVSEFLFFATPIALYQNLVDVDSTKAAAGCGIIAATIPVMAVMLIIHGRLVFPIYGMRVDTPEAAALCGHDLLRRPARHLSSLGGRDDCPEFGDETWRLREVDRIP